MVFRPSLPPNHSKTTRILADYVCGRRLARLAEQEGHGPDTAEEAESETAGADPDHVATRDAAAGQSVSDGHGLASSMCLAGPRMATKGYPTTGLHIGAIAC